LCGGQGHRVVTARLAPADRRRQLFDAVARLIKREGLARVTMVAVAAEAGVSRRLLYDYFADLSTLLRDFAIDALARALAPSAGWADRGVVGPGDVLRDLFDLFVGLDAEQRALVQVFSSASVVSHEIARVRELMEPLMVARWRPFPLLEGLGDDAVLLFAETMIGFALNLSAAVDKGVMTRTAGAAVLVEAGTATAAALRS
jgi:AcrR family transcriptional regulator